MLQVRHSIFETNSSSVHSLTFISDEAMDAFIAGELFFDRTFDKLVSHSDISKEAERYENEEEFEYYNGSRYFSYDNLCEIGYDLGGRAFARTDDLPDGGHVNYICYYGHD